MTQNYSHPNAIYLYREQTSDGFKRMRRRIMFSDQWENDYMEFIERNPLTLCSGLAYRGKSNKLEHAQRMNALIFDLDGVGLKELRNLFLRFGGDPTRLRRLPMPTYLVLSGTGLHVCYFFREPIDLYPNIKIQLKSLKYDPDVGIQGNVAEQRDSVSVHQPEFPYGRQHQRKARQSGCCIPDRRAGDAAIFERLCQTGKSGGCQ